jgi:aminoglycoside 6'-N-acetyltransferase
MILGWLRPGKVGSARINLKRLQLNLRPLFFAVFLFLVFYFLTAQGMMMFKWLSLSCFVLAVPVFMLFFGTPGCCMNGGFVSKLSKKTIAMPTHQKQPLFSFKLAQEEDLPLLFTWFHREHIAQLWPEPKAWPDFQQKWQKNITQDSRHCFIVYLDTVPVGYIHYYYVDADDRKKFFESNILDSAVGLDLFIGEPEYLGKGYGTKMLQAFIEFLKQREPDCKMIIIDPATDNTRAIACYEKVGFKKDKVYVVSYGTVDGPGPIVLMMYEISQEQKVH